MIGDALPAPTNTAVALSLFTAAERVELVERITETLAALEKLGGALPWRKVLQAVRDDVVAEEVRQDRILRRLDPDRFRVVSSGLGDFVPPNDGPGGP